MTKQTQTLLYAGLPAALLFWINTAVCGWIHGNYNHLNGTISELGALGTRSQTAFSVVVLTISLLGICFFTQLLGLQKTAPRHAYARSNG